VGYYKLSLDGDLTRFDEVQDDDRPAAKEYRVVFTDGGAESVAERV
jgi:hypothetical protein